VSNPKKNPTGPYVCDDGHGGLIFVGDGEDRDPEETRKFFEEAAYNSDAIIDGETYEQRMAKRNQEKGLTARRG
jgi:hypothetical protein